MKRTPEEVLALAKINPELEQVYTSPPPLRGPLLTSPDSGRDTLRRRPHTRYRYSANPQVSPPTEESASEG